MKPDLYTQAREYIYSFPLEDEFSQRENFKFELVKDNSGRAWLYTLDAKSPASNIYVTDSADWNKCGEGFGGGTIKLHLTNGEIFELHGGWHSNPDSLFSATGVDLRNKTLTLIHLYSESGELIYDETDWVLGRYDRDVEIIESLGLENKKIFVAHRSSGGASFGWRNYV